MVKNILLFVAAILFIASIDGCKKDNTSNEPGIVYTVGIIGSTTIDPASNPQWTIINIHFDTIYHGLKYYKLVRDTAYILDSKGVLFPTHSEFFKSGYEEDYVRLITSKDFTIGSKYKMYLKYHVEVENEITGNFELYYRNGKPERITVISTLVVGEYEFFNPIFKAIAHPSNATIPNHLITTYFTFNQVVEKIYSQSMSADIYYNYRILIDSAGICGSLNQIINTSMVLNSSKDTLFVYNPNDLNAGSTYKLKLKYHVEIQNKDESGFNVMKLNGDIYYGRYSSGFNTSLTEEKIDLSNVDYAYPAPNQYHFLKNETTRGVLKLKYNSKSTPFTKASTYRVRFSSNAGVVIGESSATYDPNQMKFVFQIPTNSLENQKIYRTDFLVANGSKKSESVFLTYYFRTSIYNSFAEKMNALTNKVDQQRFDYYVDISKAFKSTEAFDVAEGKEFVGLVRFEAIPNSSGFFNQFNWFYAGLKTNRVYINWDGRDVNANTPPLNAIGFEKTNLSPLLTQEQINSNNAPASTLLDNRIRYFVNLYYSQDFYNAKAYTWGLSNLSTWESELNSSYSRGLTPNNSYGFKVYYVAGDLVTSYSEIWSIYYF